MIVINKPVLVFWCSPAISAWWAHVTVDPEDNKTIVFRRGTSRGLKGNSPIGGHVAPSSLEGARLLWKNAQKNDEKNKTSDKINNSIP